MTHFQDFHFLRPWWLLALPLLGLIYLWIWQKKNHSRPGYALIDEHLLKHLLINQPQRAKWMLRPMHVLPATWCLLAIALSGPSWQREPSPFADEQAGLVILLKVTPSMMASDLQPTRLERASHKIKDLLAERAGAKTGLIVYSGSAHLVLPLTKDNEIIPTMLDGLSPKVMPNEGDNLTAAIIQAEQLLDSAKVAGSILILADTVSLSAADELSNHYPVQFLAMHAATAKQDTGMLKTADRLDAPIAPISFDTRDVKRIASRAASTFSSAPDESETVRWRDAGHWLLPFLALCFLIEFRKGWRI